MTIHLFFIFIDTVSLLNKVSIQMVVHDKKRLLKGYQQYE